MSVIQRIRDKGAWIVFGVIALALVAFILQDGVRRGGSVFSNNNILGKVNGEGIDRMEFEQKLTMYGRNGMDREQLVSQMWEQEVSQLILKQEFEKLGLTIPSKEIGDILFGENSPFRREFSDPQTGVFDVEKAKAAFEQIKKSKNAEQRDMVVQGYVEPAIQQALVQKYQSLIQHAVYAPKWLVEKQQADNNQIASASYVYIPYNTVSDSSVKVSDDEIVEYAKKHRKEYEREDETRTLSFVTFDASPSFADSAAALNQLKSAKAEFATTNDIKSFMSRSGSDIPYDDSLFVLKSKLKMSNADSIKALANGQTFGPYLDGSSYALARMVKHLTLPDSVFCRHILIATSNDNPASDSIAKKRIDSVVVAIKSGTDFYDLMLKVSDDKAASAADKGTMKFSSVEIQQKDRFDPDFGRFILFEGKKGDRKVVRTKFGYHYIEILDQKGFEDAVNVAYLTKNISASNETDAAANNAAAQFAASSRNKKQFDENLIKLNKQSIPSGELKENDFSIVGLGSSRQIVRWLYEHSVGDISDQSFRIGDKYVIAMVTSIVKPGLPPASILRPQIESLVKNEKKAKIIIDTKFKTNSLETIASAAGIQVQKTDSLLFSNPFIPGVGNESKLSGAAFNAALKGKVSDAIAGTSGVFAVKVENISAKPSTETTQSVQQSLMQSERMALLRGMEGLRKQATVKDYRSKFY